MQPDQEFLEKCLEFSNETESDRIKACGKFIKQIGEMIGEIPMEVKHIYAVNKDRVQVNFDAANKLQNTDEFITNLLQINDGLICNAYFENVSKLKQAYENLT